MARPPILREVVVAIRVGPLKLGKARPPQKGLKNDGVEAFAGGDKNWRGGLPIRAKNGKHLELPWCVGEGAHGDFLVHIISREGIEVGQIAPVRRCLLRNNLFVADYGVPPLEPEKQF